MINRNFVSTTNGSIRPATNRQRLSMTVDGADRELETWLKVTKALKKVQDLRVKEEPASDRERAAA